MSSQLIPSANFSFGLKEREHFVLRAENTFSQFVIQFWLQIYFCFVMKLCISSFFVRLVDLES